jgi:acyl-CoA reductase-like NAD-dependent aldehyde dehydrogenase
VNLTARAIATPLICGNTVVLKPSEFSPKSQHLIIHALLAAGLPAGCLNFLPTQPSSVPALTELAVKHPFVRRVNFTGSDRVGTIIAGWASSVLKQCVFELSSKAPVLVLQDANIPDAVDSVIFGALSNAGQICMSTERVIVHESIAEEFTTALVAKAESLKCGNHYEHPDVNISGLYTPASATRILGLVKSAVADGAVLLTGDLVAHGPNATILRPHILSQVTPSMGISSNETFGPVITLSVVSSVSEAITAANASEFSLCASIYSRDVMQAMEIAKEIRAGSVHVNGPTVYIEPPLPNGGTGGRSGYGRFGGMAGVEEYTERKMVSLGGEGRRFSF